MNKSLARRIEEKYEKLEQDPYSMKIKMELSALNLESLSPFIEIMALPSWFDISMFKKALQFQSKIDVNNKPSKKQNDLDKLFNLSFVERLPMNLEQERTTPRYIFRREYRGYLLENWINLKHHEKLVKFSQFFADYFHELTSDQNQFEVHMFEREMLSHRLIVDERDAIRRMRSVYEKLENNYNFGDCQALIEIMTKQARLFEKGEETFAWLDYYQGRLNINLSLLEKAKNQFEKVMIRTKKWPLRLRSIAGLGDILRKKGDWSGAIKKYQESLKEFLFQMPEDTLYSANKNGRTSPKLKKKLSHQNIVKTFKKLDYARFTCEFEDRLEIARILTLMANIALKIVQVEIVKDKKELVLSNVICQRLRCLAIETFEQALRIAKFSSEKITNPIQRNLIWTIRFGQAAILLQENKNKEARFIYEELLLEAPNIHSTTKIMLALGDCMLTNEEYNSAAKQYEEVVRALENTWDTPTLAQALFNLGRTQIKLKEWNKAIKNLSKSRSLFNQIGDKRLEEKVQEKFREIARDENFSDKVLNDVEKEKEKWSVHYFAYPSSLCILRKLTTGWSLFLLTFSIILGVVYFIILRAVGAWVLGFFGVEQLISEWWVNVILFVSTFVTAIYHVDIIAPRTFVGKLVPLDAFYGTQPDFISVDKNNFTHSDSEGKIRKIAWSDAKEFRSGSSASWVVGEAPLTALGRPGGRMLLFGSNGVLDATTPIDSYFELEEFIRKQIPKKIQKADRKVSTLRSNSILFLAFGPMAALFLIPIISVLISNDNSWLMIISKVIAGFFAILVGIVGISFVSMLISGLRMRHFLYPLRLSDPPPPEEEEKIESYYLENNMK